MQLLGGDVNVEWLGGEEEDSRACKASEETLSGATVGSHD